MKMKKASNKPNKEDELDEETKGILDKQLDQLVIEKPQNLINKEGKDRSLKEAFLRRPPNNIITLTYGPIPGR
jgi:hypothetical protein